MSWIPASSYSVVSRPKTDTLYSLGKARVAAEVTFADEGVRATRMHNMPMGLDKLDFTIIALYLAGITLFGLRFRKRQRTLRDYFLADRNIPWWAIALSIVAA